MATVNDFANALNANKNLNIDEKTFIIDFVGDLDGIGQKIGEIDYTNLFNNLKTLNIQNVDRKNKSGYSINDNTIYLDRNSTDKRWRVNLYKALLQCSITDRKGNNKKHGVVNSKGENFALNEAITQRFLDLMLGNSEDNILDFEMNIYAKIQEIIGLQPIIDSYFKADYESLNSSFSNYKMDLPTIAKKYDRIMGLNLNDKDTTLGDKRLISDIERLLMTGYASKIMSEGLDVASVERFERNIITPDTVYVYGKDSKDIYDGLKSNKTYFDMIINGVQMGTNTTKTR